MVGNIQIRAMVPGMWGVNPPPRHTYLTSFSWNQSWFIWQKSALMWKEKGTFILALVKDYGPNLNLPLQLLLRVKKHIVKSYSTSPA